MTLRTAARALSLAFALTAAACAPLDSGSAPEVPALAPVIPAATATLVAETEGHPLDSAMRLLADGRFEAARSALQRHLGKAPGSRIGRSLLRQLDEDPVALLGAESLPYRVVPGDTLSTVARDRLGDPHLFVALGRYNGIRQLGRLVAGETIQVPVRPLTQDRTAAGTPPESTGQAETPGSGDARSGPYSLAPPVALQTGQPDGRDAAPAGDAATGGFAPARGREVPPEADGNAGAVAAEGSDAGKIELSYAFQRAGALMAEGQHRLAVLLLEHASETRPENAELRRRLAKARMLHAEALSVEYRTLGARECQEAGRLYLQLNEPAPALQAFECAVEMDPSLTSAAEQAARLKKAAAAAPDATPEISPMTQP